MQRGQERIREAAKLGFRTVIAAARQQAEAGDRRRALIAVERVDDALAILAE